MSWHLAPTTLARYADGTVDVAGAASVETHVLRCAECRAALSGYADQRVVDTAWTEIIARLDAPRSTLLERLLLRCGVRDDHARLLAATPTLRASWLASIAVVAGFAVAAARSPRGTINIFLLIAPLLPVAGVAAAYGPGVDPTYEIGLAAPFRGVRLLMLRAASALVVTCVIAGVAALALPGAGWAAAGWLLPALGLTMATLYLGTFVDPVVAGTAVGFGWAAVTGLAARLRDMPDISGATTQLACLTLLIVTALLFLARRDTLDLRRTL